MTQDKLNNLNWKDIKEIIEADVKVFYMKKEDIKNEEHYYNMVLDYLKEHSV